MSVIMGWYFPMRICQGLVDQEGEFPAGEGREDGNGLCIAFFDVVVPLDQEAVRTVFSDLQGFSSTLGHEHLTGGEVEAATGFEPVNNGLQTVALPLGYAALSR